MLFWILDAGFVGLYAMSAECCAEGLASDHEVAARNGRGLFEQKSVVVIQVEGFKS